MNLESSAYILFCFPSSFWGIIVRPIVCQPHNKHLCSELSLIYVLPEGGKYTWQGTGRKKDSEQMGGEDSRSPEEGEPAASSTRATSSLSWRREGERKLRPAAERGRLLCELCRVCEGWIERQKARTVLFYNIVYSIVVMQTQLYLGVPMISKSS